jgi:hypothetical protein
MPYIEGAIYSLSVKTGDEFPKSLFPPGEKGQRSSLNYRRAIGTGKEYIKTLYILFAKKKTLYILQA